MALVIDGGINSTADLQSYESSILDVASSEGIDLAAKLGLAQRELEVQLSMWLARESPEASLGVGNIVVTDPLRQWHALHSLSLTYRDVYHHQLNDRFRGKWTEYSRLSESAATFLFECGLGIVRVPLRRAERPDVSLTPGGMAAATYYVRVSWCNALGSEGAPSETVAAFAPDGWVISVRANNPPSAATGWNIYAGLSDEGLSRQNASPTSIDATWRLEPSGLLTGQPVTAGQAPDYYMKAHHVLPRG